MSEAVDMRLRFELVFRDGKLRCCEMSALDLDDEVIASGAGGSPAEALGRAIANALASGRDDTSSAYAIGMFAGLRKKLGPVMEATAS